MGAPIVVNTVKVQGTVASSGTTAILGTVSQNATWNVNAAQSGTWNVGGTVNQGGTWTVIANVGSGTWPVSATQSGTWNINTITTLPAISGTVSVSSLPAISGTVAATQSGTWNIENITTLPGIVGTVTSDVGSGTRSITNVANNALYVQGTVTTSGGGGGGGGVTPGSTIIQGSGSVTTIAGTILASASNRRNVKIYNLGTSDMWIGGSTAVATNSGGRISPNESFSINDSANSLIVGISSSGTVLYSYFVEAD